MPSEARSGQDSNRVGAGGAAPSPLSGCACRLLGPALLAGSPIAATVFHCRLRAIPPLPFIPPLALFLAAGLPSAVRPSVRLHQQFLPNQSLYQPRLRFRCSPSFGLSHSPWCLTTLSLCRR